MGTCPARRTLVCSCRRRPACGKWHAPPNSVATGPLCRERGTDFRLPPERQLCLWFLHSPPAARGVPICTVVCDHKPGARHCSGQQHQRNSHFYLRTLVRGSGGPKASVASVQLSAAVLLATSLCEHAYPDRVLATRWGSPAEHLTLTGNSQRSAGVRGMARMKAQCTGYRKVLCKFISLQSTN